MTSYPIPSQTDFLESKSNKALLALTVAFAAFYLLALLFLFPRGNSVLFWVLIAGEVFHIWQIGTYIYTVWDPSYRPPIPKLTTYPAVDIFIPIAGEPVEIVEQTALAARDMDYPDVHVYLLNDGYVAKKDNWQDIEELAKRLGINCITRKVPGGAKAGNINNALRYARSEYVAIFDCDQVPHSDFLKKTMPYFADAEMGFVQSPQYYKNAYTNTVTKGAWEQQELFFGPICKGKNRLNSTFLCGTNMVLRKKTLTEAGGMCETNIAEDFLTSLFIHERGWKSVYVPEVLAEGLAPEDFLSYYKQQFRWARGSLELIFKYNPLFRKGLSFHQKVQYLSSASFFLSGIITLCNALLPVVFLFTGLIPIRISTMVLAGIFLPYMTLTIYTLESSSNYSFTFQALAFSMASFSIHIKAVMAVILNQKSGFDVTAKKAVSGNFYRLVLPHLFYLVLVAAGTGIALSREGLTASLTSNLAWALFNVIAFMPFIAAAIPELAPPVEIPENAQHPILETAAVDITSENSSYLESRKTIRAVIKKI